MPRRDPQKAIQMLDLLAEFFDDGLRWIQCYFVDHHGNRCLIGAMAHLRAVTKISGDGTASYLRLALPPGRYSGIADFNDAIHSYDAISALIARARELAQAELAATAQPKRIAA